MISYCVLQRFYIYTPTTVCHCLLLLFIMFVTLLLFYLLYFMYLFFSIRSEGYIILHFILFYCKSSSLICSIYRSHSIFD